MAFDNTVQGYIDGKRRDDQKEAVRLARKKELKNVRKQRDEVSARRDAVCNELQTREESFKKLIPEKVANVNEAKKRLADAEKELSNLRNQKRRELKPLHSQIRQLNQSVYEIERYCKSLESAVMENVGGQTATLYRDETTPWPGSSTNFVDVCKPESPKQLQGGLADGRRSSKRKPKRIGIRRRDQMWRHPTRFQ